MSLFDDDLSIDLAYQRQIKLAYLGTADGTLDDELLLDASYHYALLLFDVLRNTFIEAIELGACVSSERAKYFLTFGAARRLEMIWFAYRCVIFEASADRKHPLTSDESRRLTQALNSIYVNIRGTLDNICWALLYLFAEPKISTLRESQVGLFLPCIMLDDRFKVLADHLERHSDWNINFKERRDPSAHRIPLTVPPQEVNELEAELYTDARSAMLDALRLADVKTVIAAIKHQESIGHFVPYFIHDPARGGIPLYPTVPIDIAHLIQIFRHAKVFISNNSSKAQAE